MIRARITHFFKTYPLTANSIVYGTLYVSAEFSQQTVTRKLCDDAKKMPYDIDAIKRYAVNKGNSLPYDLKEITQYGVLGLGFYPQVYYFWYKWLDRHFVGTATVTILKKLALDQLVVTPPLIAAFYISMSIMERQKDILEECKKKIVPTYKTSCIFWLPAQCLNFFFIPPTYRVVYVGTCAFMWVNILCWFKRQEYHNEEF